VAVSLLMVQHRTHFRLRQAKAADPKASPKNMGAER
jgi:hypothetical protein